VAPSPLACRSSEETNAAAVTPLITLVVGLLSAVLIRSVLVTVLFAGYRRGLDPDNLIGPVVTTLGDLFGVSFLLIAILRSKITTDARRDLDSKLRDPRRGSNKKVWNGRHRIQELVTPSIAIVWMSYCCPIRAHGTELYHLLIRAPIRVLKTSPRRRGTRTMNTASYREPCKVKLNDG